jgi:hypothetical protein
MCRLDDVTFRLELSGEQARFSGPCAIFIYRNFTTIIARRGMDDLNIQSGFLERTR